jgi:MFS family permease
VTSLYGADISAGSAVFGWFVASYALMQFLFSPVLGNLSDTYGRRPIIVGVAAWRRAWHGYSSDASSRGSPGRRGIRCVACAAVVAARSSRPAPALEAGMLSSEIVAPPG